MIIITIITETYHCWWIPAQQAVVCVANTQREKSKLVQKKLYRVGEGEKKEIRNKVERADEREKKACLDRPF